MTRPASHPIHSTKRRKHQHFQEWSDSRVPLIAVSHPHEICRADQRPRANLSAVAVTRFHVSRLRWRYVTVLQGFRYVLVGQRDRKSTRLNSSHTVISYAVF